MAKSQTYFDKCKKQFKTMTAVEGLEKGLGALTSIVGAVDKFQKADGDPKQIISGVLDIANALAAFVPPPASLITGTVSGIFGLFMPKKPTTNQLIQDGFDDLKKVISNQTDEIINALGRLNM